MDKHLQGKGRKSSTSPNKRAPVAEGRRRSTGRGRRLRQAASGSLGSAPARWALRLLAVGLLAMGLGYLPLQFFGERGLAQYRQLKREHAQLVGRNRRLAAEIRQMQLEVQRLRGDDAMLEKAAREDLGMVRAGELIFVLEE